MVEHDGACLTIWWRIASLIIEGAIEGRKAPGRLRNLYISQLKKDAGIDCARLKRLAENEERS